MKYIITISLLLFSFCSFGQVLGEIRYDSGKIFVHGTRPELIKCKHIYVAVEQASAERYCHITEHPMLRDLILNRDWREPKIGSHQSDHDEKDMADGIAIVCVKCHHETKQKIHYSHK